MRFISQSVVDQQFAFHFSADNFIFASDRQKMRRRNIHATPVVADTREQ
jgi:hypothetical protein